MSYCGFASETLNSEQPLPRLRRSVYFTQHQPWAMEAARLMPCRFGINLWVDGTMCTGWSIIVHADDYDRAKRMFLSVLP